MIVLHGLVVYHVNNGADNSLPVFLYSLEQRFEPVQEGRVIHENVMQ
jgi:hypothetical protein